VSLPQAETQLIYRPELADTTHELLLGQHWDKKRWRALAKAVGAVNQVLEDCIFTVLLDTGLDVATGVHLDTWGETVGEDRGPLGDREYRRFIRARILANRCGGTTEEILTIARLVFDSRVAHTYDTPPASFVIEGFRGSFMSDAAGRKVARLFRTAKPAGVSVGVVEALNSAGIFDDPEHGFDTSTFARALTEG
jgi:hypothetical protein